MSRSISVSSTPGGFNLTQVSRVAQDQAKEAARQAFLAAKDAGLSPGDFLLAAVEGEDTFDSFRMSMLIEGTITKYLGQRLAFAVKAGSLLLFMDFLIDKGIALVEYLKSFSAIGFISTALSDEDAAANRASALAAKSFILGLIPMGMGSVVNTVMSQLRSLPSTGGGGGGGVASGIARGVATGLAPGLAPVIAATAPAANRPSTTQSIINAVGGILGNLFKRDGIEADEDDLRDAIRDAFAEQGLEPYADMVYDHVARDAQG